jgi:hypothetical protein
MAEDPGAAESGVKLSDLLPANLDRIDDALTRERAQNTELAAANLPKLAAGVLDEKIGEAVRGALDCDVFGLLAQAWAKARELHEFTDPAKHPRDEVSTVFLGEHSLTYDVHPVVDVVIGQLAKFTLRFTLELAADLRMAELTIRDAHITQIGKCDCELSAVLTYDSVELHEPVKAKRFTLTRSIALPAPGVPIA